MSHDEKIMQRLHEHLDAVKDKHPEWVGIFLQGSQNYGLDYEGSDVDSKLLVLPSFTDFVLNQKPVSYTHIMENEEHVDVKDIRLMFECFKKQNINFVEILFTKYSILNPKYADLFQPVLDARDQIAHYNHYAALKCMMGMALEKRKALCHAYPSTVDKIERYGYDSKQWHHIKRMLDFMTRYIEGVPYQDCLIPLQHELLLQIKKYDIVSLEMAVADSDACIEEMKELRERYMKDHSLQVDHEVSDLMNRVLIELFKRNFYEEITKHG